MFAFSCIVLIFVSIFEKIVGFLFTAIANDWNYTRNKLLVHKNTWRRNIGVFDKYTQVSKKLLVHTVRFLCICRIHLRENNLLVPVWNRVDAMVPHWRSVCVENIWRPTVWMSLVKNRGSIDSTANETHLYQEFFFSSLFYTNKKFQGSFLVLDVFWPSKLVNFACCSTSNRRFWRSFPQESISVVWLKKFFGEEILSKKWEFLKNTQWITQDWR